MVSVHDAVTGGRALFPASSLHAVNELLAEGDIEAVFQPMWRLDGSAVFAYEALSRPHPRYGLSGPLQAFEIAERFGRAAELDRLCLRSILASVDGLPENALLFINLSPYFLTHRSFDAAALRADVEAVGLEPARVVFEVTERSLIAAEIILPHVLAIREQGLSVALDDVGTGTNGFDMLRKIPFEYIKIDREIVLGAMDDQRSRSALLAILTFAKESGALAVAEGIENDDMLRLVRTLDRGWARPVTGLVFGIQGFLFGRPAQGFIYPARVGAGKVA